MTMHVTSTGTIPGRPSIPSPKHIRSIGPKPAIEGFSGARAAGILGTQGKSGERALQKEVMSQPGKSDRSLDCFAVAGPVVVEKAAISRASGLGPATVFC